MSGQSLSLIAADAILVTHFLFVAFVLVGLLCVYVGAWMSWAWVRNFRFRVMHLLAISIVVLQSWLGLICPLTIWESRLREAAGGKTYDGAFIQYWVHAILYYDAPDWVFIVAYTAFGALVLASWFMVPPRPMNNASLKTGGNRQWK